MIVSFNKMAPLDLRFIKRDNLFIILYNSKGESYKFNILNKARGTLKFDGPGVDVRFKDTWAKGSYPKWQVHAENADMDFSADFVFTNDFMPVWVEGRSANLIFGKALAGDYYIPRCNVTGSIIWEGKKYTVSGIGYHDHVWEAGIPRFVTKGWDWFNFHFDNGWEVYLSKFMLRFPKNDYAGALIISPNNRNIVEWSEFDFDYIETRAAKDYTALHYPTKYHLEASKEGMFLKLDITVLNVCEIVWKYARIGMFEGPCTVTGTFSWDGYTEELNGYGMSEVTRVKYLFFN